MSELAPKDPDVPAVYSLDFHDEIVLEALPRTLYMAAQILFFAQDTGYYYEVTTAGKTGLSYPRNLPRSSGQTVRYGSCVLTARHPSEVSLASIGSALWIVPTGIVSAVESTSGTIASIKLTGGTDGEDYEITCRMTPSVGDPIDKTITVEVRAQ